MANIKITELNAAGSLAATDVVPVVDVSADETKKITATDLFRTLPDGTAAAPALAFSSDAANGVYLAGTDTVGISTGGTQRVTVDGSGNVTISGDLQVDGATTTVQSTTVTIDDKNIELGSVATPTNTTADGGGITLKGATDKTLKWIDSTGCWTFNQPMNFNDHVRIDSSGRVGIGTTSPTDTNGYGTTLDIRGSGVGNGGVIYLRNSNATVTGQLAVYGDGRMDVGTATNHPLRFFTFNSERLRIDSSGKVGIGETSVQSTLHVAKNIADSDAISWANSQLSVATPIAGNSTANRATIYFAPYGSDNNYAPSAISATAGTSGASTLKFFTNASGNLTGQVQSYERLRIDSSGNVGIGTSSPSAPLHVSGNMYAGASIIATNNTTGLNWYNNLGLLRIQQDTSNTGYCFDVYKGGTNAVKIGFKSDGSAYFAGSVGIGTSSPTVELDVTGDARLRSTSTSDGPILQFDGAGPNGTNYTFGKIEADNTGSNNAGELRFYTNLASAGGLAQRMVIARDGNVGIATSTASGANLVIATNSNSGSGIKLIGKSSNGGAEIDFRNNADSTLNGFIEFNDSGGILSTVVNQPQVFRTNNTERMRIDSSGNVGIGTTSPGTQLHVNGSTPTMRVSHGSTQIVELKADSSASILRTTTNHPLLFGTNDTERMRIDSSGRLLVGTSSSSATTSVLAEGNSGSGSSTGVLTLARGQASPSDGAALGQINFTDNTHATAGYIIGQRDGGTWSGSSLPSRITFGTTADGASSPTERFRITSTGAWAIEGASNYGSSGQVLTSNGNDAPTWQEPAGAGAVGGGTDKWVVETDQTVTTSYELTAGKHGTTVSPTINSGATVTVPSGAILVIL